MGDLLELLTALIEDRKAIDAQGCKSVQFNAPDLRTHKHKCRHCGNVWRHTEACAGDNEAHTCSRCGATEFMRYSGGEEPT